MVVVPVSCASEAHAAIGTGPAFTQKTREGAPATGLKQLQEFMGKRLGLR